MGIPWSRFGQYSQLLCRWRMRPSAMKNNISLERIKSESREVFMAMIIHEKKGNHLNNPFELSAEFLIVNLDYLLFAFY